MRKFFYMGVGVLLIALFLSPLTARKASAEIGFTIETETVESQVDVDTYTQKYIQVVKAGGVTVGTHWIQVTAQWRHDFVWGDQGKVSAASRGSTDNSADYYWNMDDANLSTTAWGGGWTKYSDAQWNKIVGKPDYHANVTTNVSAGRWGQFTNSHGWYSY